MEKLKALELIRVELILAAKREGSLVESVNMDCDAKSGDLDIFLKDGTRITISSSSLTVEQE